MSKPRTRRKNNSKPKYPRVTGNLIKNDLELNCYKQIKHLLSGTKAKVEYETEQLEYTIISNYSPDFIINFPSGRKLYIEVKGHWRAWDAAARRKMVAVKEQHPDLDIRIIFSDNSTITKGGRMRNLDWADKYGYTAAIKRIPEEWLK